MKFSLRIRRHDMPFTIAAFATLLLRLGRRIHFKPLSPCSDDFLDDAARAGRHHQHAVGQPDRLLDAVGDEQDGLARLQPQELEIVAYLRALQFSQLGTIDDVPADLRASLKK